MKVLGFPTVPLGVHTAPPPEGSGVKGVELTSRIGQPPQILRPYVDGAEKLTRYYEEIGSWIDGLTE